MTGPTRPTIPCVGQTNIDLVFMIDDAVAPGEKHRARAMSVICGGGAANQATTIARLGGRALLVTRLGGDPAAVAALDELRDVGVDVSLVERSDEASTASSAVVVDDAGGRTIVDHADPALYFGRPPELPAVDAIVTDGRWGSATMSAIRHARDLGVPAVADIDEHVPVERIHEIDELATHIIYSERGLLHHHPDASDDVVDALHHAQRRTDAFVAVTRGERGVVWLDAGELRHRVVLDVEVVDSTGAGDVFRAAFAMALAEGRSSEQAIDVASMTAALRCTAPTIATGVPTRNEVDQRLVAMRSEVAV